MWEGIKQHDETLKAKIEQLNDKIFEMKTNNEEMWKKVNEKLDKLVN